MDLTDFSPLLAYRQNPDLDKIRYPVMVSPKLDGIRAVMLNGRLVSRKLIDIPNYYIQTKAKKHAALLDLVDGELVVGSATEEGTMQRSMHGVMSGDGEPDFTYYVFDCVIDAPYVRRLQLLRPLYQDKALDFPIQIVPQTTCSTPAEVMVYEEKYVKMGYEGIMIRDAMGRYKFGRSGLKEQLLLKLKRWEDSEGIIVDFEERYHNANTAEEDALGHTKRSSHQANMIPMNTLGAFILEDPKWGKVTVGMGPGLTNKVRDEVWNNRPAWKNKWYKYKFQLYGVKDKPRFPKGIGLRDPRDM